MTTSQLPDTSTEPDDLYTSETYILEILSILKKYPNALEIIHPILCQMSRLCHPKDGPDGCFILTQADWQTHYSVGDEGDQFRSVAEKNRIIENFFRAGVRSECPFFTFSRQRKK